MLFIMSAGGKVGDKDGSQINNLLSMEVARLLLHFNTGNAPWSSSIALSLTVWSKYD